MKFQQLYNNIIFILVFAPLIGIWMRINELFVEYGLGIISRSFLSPQGFLKSCTVGIIMGLIAAIIVLIYRKTILSQFAIVFLAAMLLNIVRSIYVSFQFKLETSEVALIIELSILNSIAVGLCVLPFSILHRFHKPLPENVHKVEVGIC